MKKFVAGLAILSTIFTGCSSDSENPNTKNPVEGVITGEITSDVNLAYGNYTLDGVVKIKPGVTLTIEAGSIITCDKMTGDNALVVENGGKLIANGTSSEPIVFTHVTPEPGSWGGIIMYGDAPIKAIGGSSTSTSEDGLSTIYGGTNSAHNGGSLTYVRVEYAGGKIADGTKELNGFSFYSVGSGTTLDHLVSYKGADDGFEFYGGTASLTNAISYGNYDDSFDWQDGWQGQNNTNWYAYQEIKGNFGMEIEACSNNNSFYPKVTNITLKRAAGCTPEVAGIIEIDAIQFKKDGNGDFYNVLIDGYGNYTEGSAVYEGAAVKIQDGNTNTNQVNTSKIKLTNVNILNTTHDILGDGSVSVTFPIGQFAKNTAATGAGLTTGNWSTVNGENLIK
ncbi:MAG: hypothetical protein ACI7YS_13185 [Flavobacterium sp.]